MSEAVISSKIVRIGTRSYRQNLESMGNNYISLLNLTMLNNDLNNLYEIIYDQIPTIKPEDYRIFGGQLQELIKTIKALYQTCKKAPLSLGIDKETETLGRNYSALYELDRDIRNFKLTPVKDESFSQLLHQASATLNKSKRPKLREDNLDA